MNKSKIKNKKKSLMFSNNLPPLKTLNEDSENNNELSFKGESNNLTVSNEMFDSKNKNLLGNKRLLSRKKVNRSGEIDLKLIYSVNPIEEEDLNIMHLVDINSTIY